MATSILHRCSIEKLSEGLNLRLPGGVKACPAPAEFFVEISQLIRSHVDLPEASICLVAAFVLSTWFVDKLAVAPYLWICGPPGSGKSTLCDCFTVCAGVPC